MAILLRLTETPEHYAVQQEPAGFRPAVPQNQTHSWKERPYSWLPEVEVRRRWRPTPVLLPKKSRGRRSLVGCSPWGREESDTTERLHFHFYALEKDMAPHPSALAWRTPGTGEPGGLPSLGSQSRTRLRRRSSRSGGEGRWRPDDGSQKAQTCSDKISGN